MAETTYIAQLDAEQQGDIDVSPKTRLGRVGTLDTTKAEVRVGAELVTVAVSEDKLKVNVKTTGTEGFAQVAVIADKNKDPNAEDNEVGIFDITITPSGTVAVPMTFGNIRDVDQP